MHKYFIAALLNHMSLLGYLDNRRVHKLKDSGATGYTVEILNCLLNYVGVIL